MADIFDFGVDFGLSFFEPLPERRQRTGTLTREEYGKQNVDFYEQSLDDSLGTGIELRFKDKDKKEDKKDDININVVGDDSGETTYDIQDTGQIGLGAGEQIGIGNTTSALGSINVGTYGQALSQAGLGDKNPFSAFGLDIYTGAVPTTTDEAKKGLAKQFTKEKLTQSGIKFAGRMLGMPAPLTSGVMGFVNGVTVSDPLGSPSFRPSHPVFGLAHDINMSIQYSNAAAISAAINANSPQIGFMGYDPTNGQIISRAPLGKTWTGTTSLSIQQLSALEALAKGYTPSSYNNQTEQGESIAASTGNYSGYDDKGVHHTINGASATGLMSHAKTAAKGRQITLNQMLNNLKTARKNTTFTGKIKDPNKTLTKLNEKSFRDNVTSGQFGGVDSLSVEQQTDIQNALSKGTGVNEYGGISAKGLTDVQSIAAQPQYSFDPVSYTGGGDDNTGGDSSTDTGSVSEGGYGGVGATAYGGQIGEGMQEGGPAGFIGGPPEKYSDQTTIADDIPLQVKEGSFVINAPAVEYAGSDDIADMLRKAYEKAGESIDKSGQTTTIPSREQIDIMISRGEVVVPPKIAKIIGYDRLEKINNRGKKEVARRKKAGDQERPQTRQANEGGVITLDDIKYKERYSTPEKARAETEKILRSIPLPDALSIMMYEEANVLGDKGLEGVAHVFVNRADAEGYKDFGNSLIDELTKRTYTKNKIFQFNALEPTKFRNTLKKLKKDKDTYLKIRNIAEEVIAGAREDFTKGALFFKNPKSSQAKDFKKMVDSGEYEETARSKKVQGVFQHIYYRPRDVGFVTQKAPKIESNKIPEGFVEMPKPIEQARPRIPESRGGSFLFRGSDYERGGATPAF